MLPVFGDREEAIPFNCADKFGVGLPDHRVGPRRYLIRVRHHVQSKEAHNSCGMTIVSKKESRAFDPTEIVMIGHQDQRSGEPLMLSQLSSRPLTEQLSTCTVQRTCTSTLCCANSLYVRKPRQDFYMLSCSGYFE